MRRLCYELNTDLKYAKVDAMRLDKNWSRDIEKILAIQQRV